LPHPLGRIQTQAGILLERSVALDAVPIQNLLGSGTQRRPAGSRGRSQAAHPDSRESNEVGLRHNPTNCNTGRQMSLARSWSMIDWNSLTTLPASSPAAVFWRESMAN